MATQCHISAFILFIFFFCFSFRDKVIPLFSPFIVPAIMYWVSQGILSCWEQKFTINHTRKWNSLEDAGGCGRRQEKGPPRLRTWDDFDNLSWFVWLLISASLSINVPVFSVIYFYLFICTWADTAIPVHVHCRENHTGTPVPRPRSQEVNTDWSSVGHVLLLRPLSCSQRWRSYISHIL